MNRKQIITSWILLISTHILLATIITLINIYGDCVGNGGNGAVALVIVVSVMCLTIGFIWWFIISWDSFEPRLINARIMYVERWSDRLNNYETVYFLEFEREYVNWFMGISFTPQQYWDKVDYKFNDGYVSKLEARKALTAKLREYAPKLYLREVKEIEVFIVEDEIKKFKFNEKTN